MNQAAQKTNKQYWQVSIETKQRTQRQTIWCKEPKYFFILKPTILSFSDRLGVKTPKTTFPCPCLQTQRTIATLFNSFIALPKAETAIVALTLLGSAIKMFTSFI